MLARLNPSVMESTPDWLKTRSDSSSLAMDLILVTGASGFIGSHIVEEIAAHGVRARALVRSSSSLAYLDYPGTELVYGDVTDCGSMDSALADVHGVIHCAGLTRARSLDHYRSVNRRGTENLLRACCIASPKPTRVVCLSSLAAYGPSSDAKPVSETDIPSPISDYGRSKLEGQRVAESFMKELSISIVVPPAVYGPRDRDIYAYFKLAKFGFAPLLGRRERYLSLVYVKDLARAAVECLFRKEADGATYFVEDGQIHTWRSVAREISSAMGKRAAAVVVPVQLIRGMAVMAEAASRFTGRPPLLGRQKILELTQPSWTCTGRRLREQLGFQPQYPLPKGVKETYRWYRENRWL